VGGINPKMRGFYSWEEYGLDVGYEKYFEGRRLFKNPLEYVYRIISFFLGYAYISFMCKHFGHDITMETEADPETGSDRIECKRCGWSHEHIYY